MPGARVLDRPGDVVGVPLPLVPFPAQSRLRPQPDDPVLVRPDRRRQQPAQRQVSLGLRLVALPVAPPERAEYGAVPARPEQLDNFMVRQSLTGVHLVAAVLVLVLVPILNEPLRLRL